MFEMDLKFLHKTLTSHPKMSFLLHTYQQQWRDPSTSTAADHLSNLHQSSHWHCKCRVQRKARSPSQPLHRGGHVWRAGRYRQSLWNSVKDHILHFLEQAVVSTTGKTLPAQAVQKVWGKEQEPSGSWMPPSQNLSLWEGTLTEWGVHSNLSPGTLSRDMVSGAINRPQRSLRP